VARILQVCNTEFYLMRFLAPLVAALARAGHQVECIYEGGPIDAAQLGPGVKLHRFEFPKRSSPPEFARALVRFRRLIRGRGFDCINSHNRNASIVARVGAFLEGVPVNLYTAHGFYFHDDMRPLFKEATLRLESALSVITDYTLSQSGEDLELVVRRGVIPADRIARIGNGIDTERFRPDRLEHARAAAEAELGLLPGRFRVGATGRLVRGKGFGDLLDAFIELAGKHAEAELVIIGGNIAQDIEPFQRQFMDTVRSRGLVDRVVVTGITNHVSKYLSTLDVFVLPSYREGMPRALLEAMSMGLPAVATEIRGCREIIADGAGFLYPPHDVRRLAELLLRLREMAPEERARIGERARRRVVAEFDERGYVARQVACIERLVAEAPRAPRSRILRGLRGAFS
jgi:glycosyltransferase involved in cell wall biosynthesis